MSSIHAGRLPHGPRHLRGVVAKEDTALRAAMATGEPLRLVSKRFGLGISTCHKLVHPRGADAAPGVVGAIHTAHVPIIAPKSTVAAYLNRRLQFQQQQQRPDAFNDKAADAFAGLKARWACLQKRTEVKLQDLPVVLGACCVLHNLCESRGEQMDPALLLARCDLDDLDDCGTPPPPDNPVRSDSASKARDEIAHSLLHRGIAGTNFF